MSNEKTIPSVLNKTTLGEIKMVAPSLSNSQIETASKKMRKHYDLDATPDIHKVCGEIIRLVNRNGDFDTIDSQLVATLEVGDNPIDCFKPDFTKTPWV